MARPRKPVSDPAPAPAPDAPAGGIPLRYDGAAWDGELAIGVETFPVRGGRVVVPPALVDAARQAGFVAER